MERVEYLISEYMKHYEVEYKEAIEMMIEDLEKAKDDKQQREDSEEEAKS